MGITIIILQMRKELKGFRRLAGRSRHGQGPILGPPSPRFDFSAVPSQLCESHCRYPLDHPRADLQLV